MKEIISLLSMCILFAITHGGSSMEIDGEDDNPLQMSASVIDPAVGNAPYIKLSTPKDPKNPYCLYFESIFESTACTQDTTCTKVVNSEITLNSASGDKDCTFTENAGTIKTVSGVCKLGTKGQLAIDMKGATESSATDGKETGVEYTLTLTDYSWTLPTTDSTKLVIVEKMSKCATTRRRMGSSDSPEGEAITEDTKNDEMDLGRSSFDIQDDKALEKCAGEAPNTVTRFMKKDTTDTKRVFLVFNHFKAECTLEFDPFFALDNEWYIADEEESSLSGWKLYLVICVCVVVVLVIIIIVVYFCKKKRKGSGSIGNANENDVEMQSGDGQTNTTYE